MSTPCPPIRWPAEFEETGPAEDPSIILSAFAHVGSIPFRIVAIRIEPRLRFMPDYRPDRAPTAYDSVTLEALLGEVGEIAGTDHPRTVELGTGSYVMWMVPEPEPGENEVD